MENNQEKSSNTPTPKENTDTVEEAVEAAGNERVVGRMKHPRIPMSGPLCLQSPLPPQVLPPMPPQTPPPMPPQMVPMPPRSLPPPLSPTPTASALASAPLTVGDFLRQFTTQLNGFARPITTHARDVQGRLESMNGRLEDLRYTLCGYETRLQQLVEQSNQLTERERIVAERTQRYTCCVCATNMKSVVFKCGHLFCRDCADTRIIGLHCPICREPITMMRELRFDAPPGTSDSSSTF